MSSDKFFTWAQGSSPQDAFDNAIAYKEAVTTVSDGYTASILEKYNFVLFNREPSFSSVEAQAEHIINSNPEINDKHGPAGCIKGYGANYLFFGVAPL